MSNKLSSDELEGLRVSEAIRQGVLAERNELRAEIERLAVSARAEANELRAKLALERDKWRGEIDREARERQRLQTYADGHPCDHMPACRT